MLCHGHGHLDEMYSYNTENMLCHIVPYPHPYVRHGSWQQMNLTMNSMIQKNKLVVEKQFNSQKMQSCGGFDSKFGPSAAEFEPLAQALRSHNYCPAFALTQVLEIGRC